MELFEHIRRARREEGVSIRELARRQHVHRRTVRQALQSALPPPRKPASASAPRLGAHRETIREWLTADLSAPRKQRHTARRIWQRLVDERGATVAESTVRAYVGRVRRELESGRVTVTIPQLHPPGEEAEVDFGGVSVWLDGVLTELSMFLMRLSHSGRAVHVCFPGEGQEAFLEGHALAFRRLGGVPRRIRYDNLKAAVVRILAGRDRVESDRFTALRSHYGFDAFFREPGIAGAHEKGGVEGEVGRFRRRHLGPVPRVQSLAELNALLEAADRADDARHIAGRLATVRQMAEAERAMLRPLPAEAFEAAVPLRAKADRKARISVRGSRYSVPAAYAGRKVDVRLGGGTITALAGGTVIARHERSAHRGGRVARARPLSRGAVAQARGAARRAGARAGARLGELQRRARTLLETHPPPSRRPRGDAGAHRGAAAARQPALHRRARRARCGGADRLGRPGAGRHRGAPHRRRPPRERRRGASGAPALRPPGPGPGRLRHAARRERAMSAPVTEQAAALTVEATSRALHLPTVRQQASALAEAALRERLSHLAYLAEVLQAELDDREARRRERRIREARFPRLKLLADFDLAAAPTVDPALLAALERGEWIDAGQPVVLLGDSGTGKSHLLIGLGMAACQRGLRVRYTTAAALVNELAEAADERLLSRVVARYGRLDLLCLDEFGYVHLDPRGAELLFQVLTEREERASVAVASNAPFSEWGQTFADPRLAAAVVDRLTFRAHIIETGSDSYRLRVTAATRGGAQTS